MSAAPRIRAQDRIRFAPPAWFLDRWGAAALRLGPPLNHTDLGRAAECVAANWLARAGWRPIGRRVPERAAELDVVAWDGEELVAVEVKASRVRSLEGLRYRPGQRLDARRLRAQRRAIRGLARRLGGGASARVDLIEVYVVGPLRRIQVLHLPDRRGPLEPPQGMNADFTQRIDGF